MCCTGIPGTIATIGTGRTIRTGIGIPGIIGGTGHIGIKSYTMRPIGGEWPTGPLTTGRRAPFGHIAIIS